MRINTHKHNISYHKLENMILQQIQTLWNKKTSFTPKTISIPKLCIFMLEINDIYCVTNIPSIVISNHTLLSDLIQNNRMSSIFRLQNRQ